MQFQPLPFQPLTMVEIETAHLRLKLIWMKCPDTKFHCAEQKQDFWFNRFKNIIVKNPKTLTCDHIVCDCTNPLPVSVSWPVAITENPGNSGLVRVSSSSLTTK